MNVSAELPPEKQGPWRIEKTGKLYFGSTEHEITHVTSSQGSIPKPPTAEDLNAVVHHLNIHLSHGIQEMSEIVIDGHTFVIANRSSREQENVDLPETKTADGILHFFTQAQKYGKRDVLDHYRHTGNDLAALRDAQGNTMLHLVFKIKDMSIRTYMVRFLCELGCDVNARDSNGQSPLHHAIFAKDLESTDFLLEYYGADLYLRDNKGLAPYQIPKSHDLTQLIQQRVNEDQTQAWIMNPMQKLGYETGFICNGYTSMVVQAILADDVASFDKRAQKMRYLNTLLFTMDVKLLSDDELKERISILGFCDGMTLYHRGFDDYQSFLSSPMVSHDNDLIAKEIAPLDLVKREGEICKVDAFSCVYKKDELNFYFNQIKDAFKGADFPLSIRLHSEVHAIAVGYFPDREEWCLANICFPPTHHEKDSRNMVKDIFEMYFIDEATWAPQSILPFTCELYTTEKNRKIALDCLAKVKENTQAINEVTVEKAKFVGVKGATWLTHSARLGDLNAVQTLVKHHADINHAAAGGRTPLCIASEHGHTGVVGFLLDNGADANKPDATGTTPMILAALHGHTEAAKLLVNKGVDINATTKDGVTALMWACYAGHADTVRFLLEQKADATLRDVKGVSAIGLAAQHGQEEIVRLLLENKPDLINFPNKNGATPLLLAINGGYEKLARFLIEHNADIECAAEGGITPLILAVNSGKIELVRLLLGKKLDINKKTNAGVTALIFACQKGYADIVQLLLEQKADATLLNAAGESAIGLAVQCGNEEVVRVLLKNSPDLINFPDKTGVTPLLLAINNGHGRLAKFLIEHNADIECAEEGGITPLILAANFGNLELVRLLLSKTPDINKKTNSGATALSIAEENGFTDIVDLLRAQSK